MVLATKTLMMCSSLYSRLQLNQIKRRTPLLLLLLLLLLKIRILIRINGCWEYVWGKLNRLLSLPKYVLQPADIPMPHAHIPELGSGFLVSTRGSSRTLVVLLLLLFPALADPAPRRQRQPTPTPDEREPAPPAPASGSRSRWPRWRRRRWRRWLRWRRWRLRPPRWWRR